MIKSSIFTLLVGLVFSQTVATVAGYDWTGWHESTKIGYINGFFSGLAGFEIALSEAESMEKERNPYWHAPLVVDITRANSGEYSSFLNTLTGKEIVQRVDGFYTEPDNIGIRIQDAFRVINLRGAGNTEKGDHLLIQFQKEYLKGK